MIWRVFNFYNLLVVFFKTSAYFCAHVAWMNSLHSANAVFNVFHVFSCIGRTTFRLEFRVLNICIYMFFHVGHVYFHVLHSRLLLTLIVSVSSFYLDIPNSNLLVILIDITLQVYWRAFQKYKTISKQTLYAKIRINPTSKIRLQLHLFLNQAYKVQSTSAIPIWNTPI